MSGREGGGALPASASRLFAKFSSQTGAVDCGDSTTAPSGSDAKATATPSRADRAPSSCSYAAASTSSPLPPTTGSCPVRPGGGAADGGTLNPLNNIPSSLSSSPASEPGLSPQRQVSSIPMAPPEKLPPHQQGGQDFWVYPSEQMFFNAMKRKGWDPQGDDMRSVVAIHNGVNEKAWREVLAWERLHCEECAQPRLKKFQGRPSDLSPKARFLNFVGFGLPFDRHDWVVDRCGKEVRYVIDFYNGAPEPGQTAPAAFFLDVRPALDSLEAAWDRVRMQFSWVASGRWMGEKR
ncbi:hypothetical protein HYH03_011763 [Edaphochlamys debaryana]|uniref:Holocytochrome c-type synthase n=1 Tax=Edaphochlamys debaryana TaxID=47281 RepID=A0A835Y2D2_9CHLO|nr:hypothetical protein HYH03_011763 [Edaphochlamys debaryana]|eukprot:KAG2489814.1 hypothetical protein HYH03_011763 [Edaphochlamys debaryana]